MNLTSENIIQMAARHDGVCVQEMLKEHGAKAAISKACAAIAKATEDQPKEQA